MIFSICILVFAFLGIIVNIMAYIFISRKKNHSMFHDLLKILTMYDFMVVICAALQFALPEIWPAYAKEVHPYVMVILLPSIHIVVMSSVYSTILISFERFIRICYYCQLRETNVITEENIKYYKIAVVLFPILFYVPKLFEISVESTILENTKLVNCGNYQKLSAYLSHPSTRSVIHQQFNASELAHIQKIIELCQIGENGDERRTSSSYRNITLSRTRVLSIVPTSLRKNAYYHQIYFVYLNTIFASVLPLCLLLFLNIRTAHELIVMSRIDKQSQFRRRSSLPCSNRESLISDIGQQHHVSRERESSFDATTIASDRRKSRVSFLGGRDNIKSPQEDSCGEEGAKERPSQRKFTSALSLMSSVRNSFSEKVAHINKERRLARISLCIVWLFIFCHAWKLIPTGYELWSPSGSGEVAFPHWIVTIENVSHMLITLNSALNFVIYIIL